MAALHLNQVRRGFTENVAFKLKPQRTGAIQRRQVENAEFSKRGDKMKMALI